MISRRSARRFRGPRCSSTLRIFGAYGDFWLIVCRHRPALTSTMRTALRIACGADSLYSNRAVVVSTGCNSEQRSACAPVRPTVGPPRYSRLVETRARRRKLHCAPSKRIPRPLGGRYLSLSGDSCFGATRRRGRLSGRSPNRLRFCCRARL